MTTTPKQFVLYQDTRGEWRWTLFAENARKIADSAEGYINRTDAIDGLRLVAQVSSNASVWDASGQAWL